MKTYCITIITTCILCITACNSTKQFTTNDNFCKENDPIFIITKDEMRLDIEKYYNNETKSEGTIIIKDNATFNQEYFKWKDGEVTNKQINKQTNIGKWIDYHPNGTIKSISFIYLKGDVKINKRTYYDSIGNITKVIDYRQADKYPICYKEALKITEGLKRKRDSIFAITRDSLVTDAKKTYVWKVFIDEPQDPEVTQHAKSWCYVISAQTGKLIKKIKVTANPG
ncbi:hypothetical protein [Aquimarina sp. I32.4]|uniref:hypothetical protein n=1 Tax=Aquimarina sp. I32.4 TaxID=2053903 RepID=UPI000CDE6C81|nr:hypothetical protein [Aquimarina sp. I32.4]